MTDKEMLIYATAYRSLTKVAAEISNNSEDQKRFEIIDWLIEQAEKAEKYRKALEFYANRDNYKLEHFDPNIDDYMSTIDYDEGQTARKALKGEN